MERYHLERGGVVVGIVTRGEWDGHQGSWPDWGLFEPSPGAEEAVGLLVAECRLHDEAVEWELAGHDTTHLLSEAARLQSSFMGPGVALMSLGDGARLIPAEVHLEGERIYWR